MIDRKLSYTESPVLLRFQAILRGCFERFFILFVERI